MQERIWGAAVACALIAIGSGLAEHRRRRRREMDRVGLVPWPLVQVLGMIGALMCAYAALHV